MRSNSQNFAHICWIFILLMLPLQLSAGPGFKWGFRERVRHTYMNNNMDFNKGKDDQQGFIRVRTNVWGQYDINKNFAVKLQLTNEFRSYTITRDSDAAKEFTPDEVIIDNLFLKYTTGGDNPLTVTVGRQNLIYGEGFIMLEGGPWDGSRAIFHDAVKVSYKRGSTTFDVLGISNPAIDENFTPFSFTEANKRYLGLPKDSEGRQWLNDGDEKALGLYITHKASKGASLEGYYFFKTEEPQYAIPTFSSLTSDQMSKRSIHTFGWRAVYPIDEKTKLRAESATQVGSQAGNKIGAFGSYFYLDRVLCPKKKGVMSAGLNILSGDDPATADVEGWNPIFSRWPKWSELYIYSQTGENIDGARKVAYWTNTIQPNVKFAANIHPKVNMTVWFHHLKALQASGPGEGKTRGNEIQLWLKVNIMKGLTGHFLYDYFMPGDFYLSPRTNATFMRVELMYTL
jgi:hypothetical protein